MALQALMRGYSGAHASHRLWHVYVVLCWWLVVVEADGEAGQSTSASALCCCAVWSYGRPCPALVVGGLLFVRDTGRQQR
eukprot:scaffold25363_cov146-Isochrysis_galbana.AAC.3